MAWEALLNAGARKTNLLVVLNDNDMSISENVGALSNYFAKVLSGRMYSTLRSGGKKILKQMPTMWELARRSEEMMKGMVLPGTIFEELGFNYIGPHGRPRHQGAGHDAAQHAQPQGPAAAARRHARRARATTRRRRIRSSGMARVRSIRSSGTIFKEKATGPTYSQVFGQWLCDMAARDPNASSASRPRCAKARAWSSTRRNFRSAISTSPSPSSMPSRSRPASPARACKPVVAIYSTFLQRAYDQLIHDVALQNLPVVFALDRAGLVGGDGATHQGSYDYSFLRCIPNLTVMAPADENECRQMLYTATTLPGPSAVRYPRGQGPGVALVAEMTALPVGKARGPPRRARAAC